MIDKYLSDVLNDVISQRKLVSITVCVMILDWFGYWSIVYNLLSQPFAGWTVSAVTLLSWSGRIRFQSETEIDAA